MVRSLLVLLGLLNAIAVFAESQTVSGKPEGPVVAFFSAEAGTLILLHDGAPVTKYLATEDYVAAVVLAGPSDSVTWDGGKAELSAGDPDPVAVAKELLEGRDEASKLLVQPDGTVDDLGADGTTGASASE